MPHQDQGSRNEFRYHYQALSAAIEWLWEGGQDKGVRNRKRTNRTVKSHGRCPEGGERRTWPTEYGDDELGASYPGYNLGPDGLTALGEGILGTTRQHHQGITQMAANPVPRCRSSVNSGHDRKRRAIPSTGDDVARGGSGT